MAILTPDQIERRVERFIDHADKLLLRGDISQRNYDLMIKDLAGWAEDQYERRAFAHKAELRKQIER